MRISTAIPQTPPPLPRVSAGQDALSSYDVLRATVAGPPVSVTFAIRSSGGAWKRVAIDDSSPYRAFVDPGTFPKHAQIQIVAIARGIDGKVSASRIVTFVPRP